ncbi:hypothetical protein FN846DRAFT_512928 [Sphaerosporella brunnea]|uniref:Uncharacterized protein n=1 Tax=Sphaerosporella brunnea TaxID=1250544 RepID=A0A5J5F3I9_9PEZI|nr:hypothetical protein FN846DRAFT_512928 [Sphaerosporella brunnea]
MWIGVLARFLLFLFWWAFLAFRCVFFYTVYDDDHNTAVLADAAGAWGASVWNQRMQGANHQKFSLLHFFFWFRMLDRK